MSHGACFIANWQNFNSNSGWVGAKTTGRMQCKRCRIIATTSSVANMFFAICKADPTAMALFLRTVILSRVDTLESLNWAHKGFSRFLLHTIAINSAVRNGHNQGIKDHFLPFGWHNHDANDHEAFPHANVTGI